MKTSNLNIIEAVTAAKEGHKIRMSSWIAGPYVFKKDKTLYLADCETTDWLDEFTMPIVNILATDWEIVSEPPKTMTFQEAMEKMESGEKVKRLYWGHSVYLRMERNTFFMKFITPPKEYQHHLSYEDIKATDWVVAEEEKE